MIHNDNHTTRNTTLIVIRIIRTECNNTTNDIIRNKNIKKTDL